MKETFKPNTMQSNYSPENKKNRDELLISVVAPMYNEEAVIPSFIEKTLGILKENFKKYELILVDDGSADQTVQNSLALLHQHENLKIIAFSRNYGHEIASTAGLEHAQGDYIILMDSDLQHPPELIPDLVNKALEGFDVVQAARANRDEQSWLKRQTANLFYKIANKMTGFELKGEVGNFRLLSRRVANSITQLRESNRHLLMLFAYVGFPSTSIPYVCQERFAGASKYSYRKLINLALDSIISFSHRPLRYMSILSVIISMLLTFYAGFIVLQKIFAHQQLADGMASVIFIMSGLFAILFLFLAIISEYISRILIESKNRPLYYIKQMYQSTHYGMTSDTLKQKQTQNSDQY